MGHIRLGQLPRGRLWREVIDLLAHDARPDAVAASVARATDERLEELGRDPTLSYLYWLLTRVTWHARGEAFADALVRDGILLGPEAGGVQFLADIGKFAAREVRQLGNASAISEIALRAFRECLSRAIEQRANTLFGATGSDVQQALRELSTPTKFANVSRQFFGTFLSGLVQFVVSKESSNHVGLTRPFLNSEAAASFEEELGAFAFQSTRVLQEYSGEWYSKHNWLGDIDRRQAQRFVAYAMKKLRMELKLAGASA